MPGFPGISRMFESIEAALASGDAAAALAAARELVAQQPDDPRALHLLGIALRLSGDAESAAAPLDRAIALAPDDAQLHLARAMLALSTGDSETAFGALDQATVHDPNALAAYVLRGHTAVSQGDQARAEAQLGLAQRVNPDHPHVLALEGNLALAFGEAKDALPPLTQAVQAAPDDAFVLSCLGLAFLATGNPAFAEQSLRRALEKQPEARRLRWALIDALRRQEQFGEAMAELDALLQAQPDDAAALALKGDLYIAMGELDQALACFRRLLSATPRPGRALAAVLRSLLQVGVADAAELMFDEQVRARPTDDEVWVAGLVLQPEHAKALEQYAARWLAQVPDSVAGTLARAEAAERLGDLGAAEDAADLVLGLEPASSTAHFIKLRAELRLAPEAALERAERLLGAARNIPARRTCLVWRGFALNALGRSAEAVRSWTEARELPAAARPLPETAPPAGEPQPSDEGVPPRLLWGLPGSPVRQIVWMLHGIEGFQMLDDRFGMNPRQDGLGPDRPDGAFATQQGWRLVAERSHVDIAHALDWLLHFDRRHATQLPDARLMTVLADPRDLLLNWLAYGSAQEYHFPGPVEAGDWLAKALLPLAERIESGREDDLLVRLEDVQQDPAGCAAAIGRFCGLPEVPDSIRLASAMRGLGDQPMAFPAGHWRAYAEPLAEAFAPLHAIATRLGYASA